MHSVKEVDIYMDFNDMPGVDVNKVSMTVIGLPRYMYYIIIISFPSHSL